MTRARTPTHRPLLSAFRPGATPRSPVVRLSSRRPLSPKPAHNCPSRKRPVNPAWRTANRWHVDCARAESGKKRNHSAARGREGGATGGCPWRESGPLLWRGTGRAANYASQQAGVVRLDPRFRGGDDTGHDGSSRGNAALPVIPAQAGIQERLARPGRSAPPERPRPAAGRSPSGRHLKDAPLQRRELSGKGREASA